NAGIGDEAIVAKIKSSDVEFDTTTDAVIQLNGKGISGPVIAAMVERAAAAEAPPIVAMSLNSSDPMVPHPPGLYLLHDGSTPHMQRIDYTVSSQAKTGGIFGYAL